MNERKLTNCVLNAQDQENLLLDYATGALDGDKLAAYQRHLGACAECREMVELQRQAFWALEEWEAPAVSTDFDARLFQKIRETEAAAPWWKPLQFLWNWRTMVPVGAAAAVALAAFLMRPADVAAPDSLQGEDLAVVEQTLEDMEALHALHEASGAATADAALKESL
jgi:anti-sigma-K factor RskA